LPLPPTRKGSPDATPPVLLRTYLKFILRWVVPCM